MDNDNRQIVTALIGPDSSIAGYFISQNSVEPDTADKIRQAMASAPGCQTVRLFSGDATEFLFKLNWPEQAGAWALLRGTPLTPDGALNPAPAPAIEKAKLAGRRRQKAAPASAPEPGAGL